MKIGRMNKLNNQNNYLNSTEVESNKRLVKISVSRKNIVIKNNMGRFKRGPYKGASLSLSPEDITTLYETGKAVGEYALALSTTYVVTRLFTNRGAQASRGTDKICNFMKPIRKIVCGKPLYYRDRIQDSDGRTIEVYTCDDGHEFTQPTISTSKLNHKKARLIK